jgi:hypothetical protein
MLSQVPLDRDLSKTQSKYDAGDILYGNNLAVRLASYHAYPDWIRI